MTTPVLPSLPPAGRQARRVPFVQRAWRRITTAWERNKGRREKKKRKRKKDMSTAVAAMIQPVRPLRHAGTRPGALRQADPARAIGGRSWLGGSVGHSHASLAVISGRVGR